MGGPVFFADFVRESGLSAFTLFLYTLLSFVLHGPRGTTFFYGLYFAPHVRCKKEGALTKGRPSSYPNVGFLHVTTGLLQAMDVFKGHWSQIVIVHM